MRILITNDDGIEATGIAELARAVGGDHEVVVAAPAWNSSGASASITGVSQDGRLLVQDARMELPAGTRAIVSVSSARVMTPLATPVTVSNHPRSDEIIRTTGVSTAACADWSSHAPCAIHRLM